MKVRRKHLTITIGEYEDAGVIATGFAIMPSCGVHRFLIGSWSHSGHWFFDFTVDFHTVKKTKHFNIRFIL